MRIIELNGEAAASRGEAQSYQKFVTEIGPRPPHGFDAYAVTYLLNEYRERARYADAQAKNLAGCPAILSDAKADPKFSPYPKRSGELIFHRGGKGFLGQAAKMQAECAYDQKTGKLVIGWPEGTVNEYSNTSSSILHTFADRGGVLSWNGLRGIIASVASRFWREEK